MLTLTDLLVERLVGDTFDQMDDGRWHLDLPPEGSEDERLLVVELTTFFNALVAKYTRA